MRFFTASRIWVGLVLLIITFTCLRQIASAQTGFMSLDCGAPRPYVDKKGISWVPDDTYISSGKTASIDLALEEDPLFDSDLKEVRYFPDVTRTRYCYSLPTTTGQTYFIRATHFNGRYDNNSVVKFDVALDVYSTKVTLAFITKDELRVFEYFFRAYKDSTQYCLYRLPASGNPFISSLELRPLDSIMYAKVADGSALSLQYRINFGGTRVIRYPDDPYDRLWFPLEDREPKNNVNSTSVVDTGHALERPPPAVMNTAIKANDRSFSYILIPLFHENSFLINVYLAELQPQHGRNRTFDILINDVVVSPNVNIYSSAGLEYYKPIEYTFNGSTINTKAQLNVTLARTGSPTNPPPLWNALEFFSVHKKLPGTFAADEGAIEGVKKAFGLGAMWAGDPCVLNPYDWLLCSADASPRITAVNLSSANLSGQIPDMTALTSLTTLYLDNNQLTGPVPDWLASLPNLKELHLQNNAFTGSVPKALLNLPGLRVEGNPGLCANVICPSDEKKPNVGIIVGVVVGVLAVVGIAVAVIVVLCCRRRRPTNKMGQKLFAPPVSETVMVDGTTTRGSRYTLAQVMTATNRNAKLLGKGGFGPVYYGKLASGQEVAVKVATKGSNQGSKEFINEIKLLTRVHHKNLVSLVGYCDEGDNLILLYEYMSKGTVQEHLYGVGDLFLDWKTRLQVALYAAQGLEYLHVGCHPVIFHRDVKSNNILLNDKLVAKVADFGLSKSGISNATHMSTMVKGTIGYLDPEYYMTNQLTDKSDVYGFGIFLLELLCARPPFIQHHPQDHRRIDHWVRRYLENGTIEEVVDPALRGQYNLEVLWKVAALAMQSVEPQGKHRPNMSTVVHELRSAVAIENNESSSSIAPPHAGALGQDSVDSVPDPQYGANPAINTR